MPAVGGRHRVHPAGVERQVVEQRVPGLLGVAVGVVGGDVALVAPPDVDPAQSTSLVRRRRPADRLVDRVARWCRR